MTEWRTHAIFAVAVLIGLLSAWPVVAQDQKHPAEIKRLCDELNTLLIDLRKRYPANHPRILLAKDRLTDLQKSYPCICFPPSVVPEDPCLSDCQRGRIERWTPEAERRRGEPVVGRPGGLSLPRITARPTCPPRMTVADPAILRCP
jgi:hypothetical protein